MSEFDGEELCYYESWESKTNVGADGKQHRNTIKKKIQVKKLELVLLFVDSVLPVYIRHRATNQHQKDAVKILKSQLNEKDVLVHVDYAENYQCKYAREAQVIHFGGNRKHVSLHTCVVYVPR
mgnify:CR=1 FL=1